MRVDPRNTGSGWSLRSVPSWVVTALAVDPKGKLFACRDAAGLITIWDLRRGEVLLSLPALDEGPVRGLAFVHKGEALASIRGSKQVTLWDVSDL